MLRALLGGGLDKLVPETEAHWQVPDFVPEEWDDSVGEESTG